MAQPSITISDTETGGTSEVNNPLLSVATIVCDTNIDEVANYYTKIRPPAGTVLAIPFANDIARIRASSPGDKFFGLAIEGYRDVYTGYVHEKRPADAKVIEPGAALVNGFVTKEWDPDTSIQEWLDTSIDIELADNELGALIRQWFPDTAPINLTYNVPFDSRFLKSQMPVAWAALGETWKCAMNAVMKYVKATTPGARSGWKLSDACKIAGVENPSAHDSLGDARSTRPVVKWLFKNNHI